MAHLAGGCCVVATTESVVEFLGLRGGTDEKNVRERRWSGKQDAETRYIIPEVLRYVHDRAPSGHLSVMKTLHKVRERFHWMKCSGSLKECCQNVRSAQLVMGYRRSL